MEKYAVVENIVFEKKANVACPRCGREVDKDAPVAMCAVHGTEPFEQEDPWRSSPSPI